MTTAQAPDVSYNRVPTEVLNRWRVVRDVINGGESLRTDDYLPQLNPTDTSDENKKRNAAYRQRAVWYPATQFTQEGLVGLAFHNDPTTNLPPKLEYLLKDADGCGVSLYQQSQATLANNLAVGRHGLFVDFAEGLQRPVIKAYCAENIVNWRYEDIGGAAKLKMIVLKEEVEEDDGAWGVKCVSQWREVFLSPAGEVTVRVWREDPAYVNQQQSATQVPKVQVPFSGEGDNAVFEQVLRSRGAVLTEIPFTFIGSRNNDATIDASPLYGLAQINLAHFRNSADFEDSVFFCGQVQPWISGLDEKWRDFLQNPYIVDENGVRRYTGQRMYVGSRSPLLLPKDASFGMAQAEPNTLVQDAMKHKEEQMIAAGARMIESTQPNKTATGENNDREATTSVLSMCVSNVNEAYQKAIGFCARFLDIAVPEKGFEDAFKIQQDFASMTADAQLMAELVKSWQAGLLAKNDVRDFYRKLGLVATERTNEAIDRDIEKDGPPLGTMDDGAPGGTPPGGRQPAGAAA